MLLFANFSSNSKNKIWRAMASLALTSLAFTAQAQPEQAKESEMGACRYLTRVSGDSGYGKNSGWQALAKYAALQRAEKLGASHVVWERFTPVGAFNGMAEAKAYVCEPHRAPTLTSASEPSHGVAKTSVSPFAAD